MTNPANWVDSSIHNQKWDLFLKNRKERVLLGNFIIIPQEIRDKIIYSVPIDVTKGNWINSSLNFYKIMQSFWNISFNETAKPSNICPSIDPEKFFKWMAVHKIGLFNFLSTLKDQEKVALQTHAKYLRLDKYLEPLLISPDFNRYTRLESLDLRNCVISNNELKMIVKATQIQKLYLNNNLNDEGIESITKLKKLQTLCLEIGNLTHRGLEHIGQCPNLQQLKIASSGLCHENMLQPLNKFTNLNRLAVGSRCLLTHSLIHSISQLTKLQFLTLSMTTDQSIILLKKFTHLQSLKLNNCIQSRETIKNLEEELKIKVSPNYLSPSMPSWMKGERD